MHEGEEYKFQSTPPVKAATRLANCSNSAKEFQSTPPVKAATYGNKTIKRINNISIHAAREGGDATSRKREADT